MNDEKPASPTAPDPRKLLFISYAYENETFAKWLARKLAFYGYGVWFDQLQILGGESWVKEVDVAIKERSFRVLGLLSKSSIAKDNPRKERTLALQLGKQRKVDDFLITLNLDGVQPDWTLSDISWISFRDGWADGLRRLLKKLESLSAPRIHAGNSSTAKAQLVQGPPLLVQTPETLVTNWMPFIQVPEALWIFDTSGLNDEQQKTCRDVWPHYSLDSGRVAAFSPPPPESLRAIRQTKEVYHWPSFDSVYGVLTHNVISRLLNRSVHSWLLKAGCVLGADYSTYYLPSPFRDDSIFRFKDMDGTPSYIRVMGTVRFYRPNTPPEEVTHHPAIRYNIRKTDYGAFVIQLRPGVALFDGSHNPITGRKVGPRTKKVTRAYFNDKWRKRLMAFSQLLAQAVGEDKQTTLRLGDLVTLNTNWMLDETPLAPVESPDDLVQEEVHVSAEELQEMEDSQDE